MVKREPMSYEWLVRQTMRRLRREGKQATPDMIKRLLDATWDRIQREAPMMEAHVREEETEEAARIATEGRPKYGDYRANMLCIAQMWSAFIEGRTGMAGAVRDVDVPVMMQLLKAARIATGNYSPDHQLDITGYGSLYTKMCKEMEELCGQNGAEPPSSSAANSAAKARDLLQRGSRRGSKKK